jgi:hypothetical protein
MKSFYLVILSEVISFRHFVLSYFIKSFCIKFSSSHFIWLTLAKLIYLYVTKKKSFKWLAPVLVQLWQSCKHQITNNEQQNKKNKTFFEINLVTLLVNQGHFCSIEKCLLSRTGVSYWNSTLTPQKVFKIQPLMKPESSFEMFQAVNTKGLYYKKNYGFIIYRKWTDFIVS